ncbi:MAG: DUF4080 domain-containing protein [Eubacteriales bacterium]|nr:DUF4080 domain-containing protein [Eubacteriales bacterium]
MKTTFVALNSRYIHASLAPWCLKAACSGLPVQIDVLDLCINQPREQLLRAIAETQPDVLGFSCYIFNISLVRRLIPALRLVLPDCYFFMGGPEVSFDALEQLQALPQVDAVVSGEGEVPVRALLADLLNGAAHVHPGITLRTDAGFDALPPEMPVALPALPSPYTPEMLRAMRGKIAYYEASRGCPFRCSYCLSHLSAGTRSQEENRVRRELLALAASGARQIKFVDRTFNASRERAMSIWQFLLDERGKGIPANMNFHFEAAPDLFTEEMFTLLAQAPAGYFQLEIGIQTFYEETLKSIHRTMDIALCKATIRRLAAMGNLHIHVDLIAGLPGESLDDFRGNVNAALALRPHCLQLGFLKLLKGSRMREQAEELGYRWDPEPPYEVLSTPWIGYAELGELKMIDWACDHFYNSGRFAFTLSYATEHGFTPYQLLHALGKAGRAQGLTDQGISAQRCSALLLDTLLPVLDGELLCDLLKIDWLCSDNTGNLPPHLSRIESAAVKRAYAEKLLPCQISPTENLRRDVHIEAFREDGILPGRLPGQVLFVTDRRAAHPVTGRYACGWM